jgi:hypothetical protein
VQAPGLEVGTCLLNDAELAGRANSAAYCDWPFRCSPRAVTLTDPEGNEFDLIAG